MMTTSEVTEMYKAHVIPTYAPSLVLTKGRGTRVWDSEGKVYLDFIAGIAVVNLGHCHPAVVDAIREQAGELMHVSNLFYNTRQAELARKLSSLALGGKCFFCNSGAEANEALIKLARLWGAESGRYEIICMKNSFHGRTLATVTATGQTKYQEGFAPLPEGFVYAEFNDLESVRALVNEKTVGILVEAVQGEGGVVPAETAFLQGIRALCDEKNLLMLCDEVQCGLGRTGRWFAFQHAEIEPDAFSVAKSLGNGFPIGAIVTAPKLADVFQPGRHASTFGGTPLACAAALATLTTIESEHLLNQAAVMGSKFRAGLEALVGTYAHVQSVRGQGLMLGIVLDAPAKDVVDAMRDMGLIALATAGNVVRFLPPLTVKESELDEALEIIEDALAQWHGMPLPSEAGDDADETPSADAPNAQA